MPTISILVTTFNRKETLARALDSIFSQTFTDFEIIIIDDASTDGTDRLVVTHPDPRIRYYRNPENQGAAHGDRVHIKRFMHELAKGKYAIYLCDDDRWVFPTMLARQIALLEAHPGVAMVIGGQASHFIPPGNKQFHDGVYPKYFMSSDEFLSHFAQNPITCNIIIGATLYNREIFIKSGALQSETGTKWQAGYEMLMAPGCYGDVVYINDPCVETEIRATNASFNRTQLDHYQDCVTSVKDAFTGPLRDWQGTEREGLLMQMRKQALTNIGAAFLRNATHIKNTGRLSMCSEENMERPVTEKDIVRLEDL